MKFITSAMAWLRARPVFSLSLLVLLLATLYWSVVASDVYVSEAHIVIQRTDATSSGKATDVIALMTGSNGNRDLMLLRDYLQSTDMMIRLDKELNLREHYSDSSKDFISRLWGWNRSYERFHDYYLSRVKVDYDDYSQVLVIHAEGYSPRMAHAIAESLLRYGEHYMNQLDNKLALEQVEFIETQISEIQRRMQQARDAVVAYQNKHGLVSPVGTVESVSAVVAQLEQTRADLQARKEAMAGYLTATAPDMVQLNAQISAVSRQIAEQNGRLASSSNRGLNVVAEHQEQLELRAGLAETVYKSALGALEKQRIDAIRKTKSVQVLQAATFPDYPMQPRRIYNVVLSAVVIALLAVVSSLLIAIIRDHHD